MSSDPYSELTARNFIPKAWHDTYPFIAPQKHNLSGKSVLVTGASKGIGRATAIAYASAGASTIIIAARSPLSAVQSDVLAAAEAAKRPAPKVLCLQVDVSAQDSVDAAAKEVEREVGRLDVVINNAGRLEKFVPIVESDPTEWWQTWTVNILGPYLVCRAFLPLLLKGGDKTILNVSSIGAHTSGIGGSAYRAGKLALLRFSEFINVEYGDKGVLSYAVHPGGVPTELALNMPERAHSVLIDTPELSGDAIVWLTSEKREWLAGRYIDCTWDMEGLLEKKEIIEKGDLLKVRMAVR